MRVYRLKNKSVIRIKNKAEDFLKAYASNTPDRPRNAFLNIRGQIVATFDQLWLSDEGVLIVIEKQFFGRLEAHLKKFLALSDTVLTPERLNVTYDLDGDYPAEPGEFQISEKKGRLLLTLREILSNIVDEEFTLFRLKNDLPLQGVDYDEELLLNVADEEFISYTKGCYLGQEIIARVHHRSAPPKKLMVRYETDSSAEETARMTSKTMDPVTKTNLGFTFVDQQKRI